MTVEHLVYGGMQVLPGAHTRKRKKQAIHPRPVVCWGEAHGVGLVNSVREKVSLIRFSDAEVISPTPCACRQHRAQMLALVWVAQVFLPFFAP